jgi:Ferritin-like domain
METGTNHAKETPLSQRPKIASGRRDFLRTFGLGAAGASAFAATGLSSINSRADATLDAEILTFALNLEYLEAEFYLLAATGQGLPASETGSSPGPVTGGRKVAFTNPLVAAYANEIAAEEHKHVQFLRAALIAATGSAISRPTIDFRSSFPTLALVAGLGTGFDAFKDDTSFLLASYVFEDVGVTAYHGAAPLITYKPYLDRAAGILAVEAYHAGLIRTVLFVDGKARETALISNLRATLDGTVHTTNLDDYGVGTQANPTIVLASNANNGSPLGGFPSNTPPGNNAIAFDRTTRQVLNIVYGEQNASSGLFFPKGLNGAIK